ATRQHPSADQVWQRVQQHFPLVSRATVYNTLNLMVAHGLLKEWVLTPGHVVFDPKLEPHHHLVDVETGEIHDVPWDAVRVPELGTVADFEIDEYQMVLRGRRARRGSRRRGTSHS
ncbi:MAG: transcriptional repressor, partial [Myxococcales bacterium]|nr:transcriptional repressor [Myxococcales bacterium]